MKINYGRIKSVQDAFGLDAPRVRLKGALRSLLTRVEITGDNEAMRVELATGETMVISIEPKTSRRTD